MKRKLVKILFILIDIGIIVFSFLFIAWLRAGTRIIVMNYARSLVAFGLTWLLVGLWGQKFTIKLNHSGRSFAINMLKTDLITVAVIFGLIVFFQKFYYSRYIVFGTIGLTAGLEFLFFVGLYYALQFHKESDSYASSRFVTKSPKLENSFSDRYIRDATKQVPKLDNGLYNPDFGTPVSEGISDDLWQHYLVDHQTLYVFLKSRLNLTAFHRHKTLVLNSDELESIKGLPASSQQMFINLHEINDFRRLNQYLIKVNESLVPGGVYICCGETISARRNRFFRKFTPYLGVIFYAADFVYRRVLPKIPIVQGWYFALTKGRNRALSETEMIGRFYFCGFDLVSKDEINGLMHFVLRKIKPWSNDPNPSYGPLIKLKRVGKEGEIIYIKKLRTMHPYSEYLQDYVFRTSDLQEGGKFSNDFRITSWGRVFRTLWIDELPQIYNFLKGEVSFIGVRALSEHYFDLYPPDLQELRCQFKPGLVPPFYADMPKSFEEILASERNYLEQKQQQPFATDWKYFWKAFWNILFRHARSK
jgi:lipopolysaccharide/colanic/teichoic acid biosynthesis glycosyltransferase